MKDIKHAAPCEFCGKVGVRAVPRSGAESWLISEEFVVLFLNGCGELRCRYCGELAGGYMRDPARLITELIHAIALTPAPLSDKELALLGLRTVLPCHDEFQLRITALMSCRHEEAANEEEYIQQVFALPMGERMARQRFTVRFHEKSNKWIVVERAFIP